MAPTSAVIALNTLPATNAGNSNLYADTSADSDPSPPSTGGIVLCVAGAILAITSVFILRLYLQWREEQKLKNEPNSLWQRTKTLSISNITSMTMTRTSITSPNASNTSSNACHMMTTPVSTEIAPDKEQRLTEIWNESEQTVHEIDIDFNDLNGKSPPPLGSHKQSIGYIEAIFASCSAGEEAEESKEVESPRVRDPISPFTSDHDVHPDDRDQSQHSPSNQASKPNGGDIENESSSTKMADPDPRDDPNWRSPSKKYRITVVSIDDLEEARLDIDGFEEERVGRHDRDEYRHAGPRHMVQVHSQSVSEYAGSDIDDDDRHHIDREIGNTFERTNHGFYHDEEEEEDEIYPIDPHREDGHGRGDTLETLVMTDGAPITPPLPTVDAMEEYESGHSRQSSVAESVLKGGFEAEESIEEDSDSLAVVGPVDD